MVELGQKHECSKCGIKFYDLGKAEPVCPKCGPEEETEDAQADEQEQGGEEE